MKILFLADENSPHIIKWATSIAEKNIEVFVYGFNPLSGDPYSGHQNIRVKSFNVPHSVSNEGALIQKFRYLKSFSNLKREIKLFSPDLIHAHYATSYGLLGSLTNFHPFVISVWGSDVYDFPGKSVFHKSILKYNLKKADKVLSTSHCMAKETKKFTTRDVEVLPFGIDTEKFKPIKVRRPFHENDLVIGSIKMLEDIYGIEYLIKAFKMLKQAHPDLSLKLLIVGTGSQASSLKKLTVDLNIGEDVTFTGMIGFKEISDYHNMIDIFVGLSKRESFGVSALEASACGKPVVVSNVGGLPEVVENDVTGIVVLPKNELEAFKALEKLVLNPSLRKEMGEKGIRRVKDLYNWNDNVNRMISIYQDLINRKSAGKK